MRLLLLLICLPLFGLSIDLPLNRVVNKIRVKYCIYGYGINEVVHTIPNWKQCPVSIKQEI